VGDPPARLGDTRTGWTAGEQRTTMVILVDGRFRVDLDECSVTLASQGDYLIWGPGIDHSWQALATSVLVVIRWPSQP
jgi:quercetin dioxygenase-like cupin family protein